MSRIATGVRFTDKAQTRAYGYLAIFSDGDVKRHTTDYPKSHCVRVQIAPSQRWQSVPITGGPVVDGLNLVHFPHEHFIYEWFKTEEEAVREVRKAASMTQANFLGQRHWGGEIHPLNQQWANNPYYKSIEIVVPKVVWAYGERLDSLRELNDPRIKVSTPAMVAESLRRLALEAA